MVNFTTPAGVAHVEIRPLFSQTCTARIQKFPDGSGSPQMVLDVSRILVHDTCQSLCGSRNLCPSPTEAPRLNTDRNTELRIL
eukprot:jgi/Chrzof1/2024/UNPLg00679.t1